MLLDELGARIRARREKRGLKQTDIAAALQISPQAVSKWERGENAPDIAQLPALARLLDVSIDWLLGAYAETKDVFEATVFASGVPAAREKSAHLPPREFAAWANAFCYQATELVLGRGGVPVKSMGPGLLCFFSGPRHARRAIAAALSFREGAGQKIKLGLGTGQVYLGTMGHPDYANPDIMGEAVSIALLGADWAAANTESGVAASAATLRACRKSLPSERARTAQFTGIAKPVTLYEIIPGEWSPLPRERAGTAVK